MDQGSPIHRTHCIRCGECCIASSPTLQKKDIPLVKKGILERKNLYTIRARELVRDPVQEKLIATDKELIKIKEKGRAGVCVYYDEEARACSIYEHRPLQCAALACWDTTLFHEAYNTPKAGRKDIVGNRILLGLMEAHDRRCSYAELEASVKRIQGEGEKAIQKILELLKYDYHFRPFISKKMDIAPEEMDFLFGRPLMDTIHMFGLQVMRKSDGSFFLTPLES
ncbi:MAG: YkgJ family cysteine cluster protein, partial [Deltaproteobacteria bacterium]|nr:YkgJ family cysteine cluster protein [Deltaproteobacteria bacterium]